MTVSAITDTSEATAVFDGFNRIDLALDHVDAYIPSATDEELIQMHQYAKEIGGRFFLISDKCIAEAQRRSCHNTKVIAKEFGISVRSAQESAQRHSTFFADDEKSARARAFLLVSDEKRFFTEAMRASDPIATLEMFTEKITENPNYSTRDAQNDVRSIAKAAHKEAAIAALPAISARWRVGVADISTFRSFAETDDGLWKDENGTIGDVVFDEDSEDELLLSLGITPGSVDVLITDPPYPGEFIPLFANLSRFAQSVLKPGGLLVCMSGQSYLPEVTQHLCRHLSYQWTCAYLTPGGQATQIFPRKVNTFWKPLLIFSNGKYEGAWYGDVTRSDVNDNDKRFHEWGQSESGMADIIERFSRPGDLICDPFLGAGTTGVAALAADRRFIGFDIDAARVDVSRVRLTDASSQ